MSEDPVIICFAHCNDQRVYCQKILTVCPICNSNISSYVEEPFRIPYPCKNAAQNPCSVAVRPSHGSFLEDYNPTDDLHISVVNSEGRIFEFDSCGLVIDNFAVWKNCLSFSAIPESWQDHWDATLSELIKSSKWSKNNYDSSTTNCFTFVIDFFKALKYAELEFCDKENFCKFFVLPKIQETMRYISLYRILKLKEYYIP